MFTALLLPAIYLWYREANPGLIFSNLFIIHYKKSEKNFLVSSFFALAGYTCLSMKLVSYYQVNKYYRLMRQNEKRNHKKSEADKNENNQTEKKISYPENLNVKNMYYFMAVPTLCYELNFPRTERIRKSFLFRRLAELVRLK